MTSKPVKIAVLGLGYYAENWIAPAIVQSEYAELTSIITGSPNKIAEWKNRYQIKDSHIYDYDNLDTILDNKEIDTVVQLSVVMFVQTEKVLQMPGLT